MYLFWPPLARFIVDPLAAPLIHCKNGSIGEHQINTRQLARCFLLRVKRLDRDRLVAGRAISHDAFLGVQDQTWVSASDQQKRQNDEPYE